MPEAQARYELAKRLHERYREVVAQRLYEKAAAAGHPAAMNALGRMLARPDRLDEAVAWLRRAVAAGHAEASWNLAMILRAGPDAAEADHLVDMAEQQWLQVADRATGQGAATAAAEAAENLTVLYRFRGDEQRHRHWTAETEARYRAAARAGHPDAERLLGEWLLGQGRDVDAEPWLSAAARAGDDRAMVTLAVVLRDRGERRQAQRWLRRAAWKRNARAMGGLGEMYAQDRRISRAKWWLRLAARAGNPTAMNNLGILLKMGGHYVSAAFWYRRAVAAGHRDALHNLRIMQQETGWW